MRRNVVIGGAWPYANSSLHLGHLCALLPGDFLARYHRKKNDNVIYVSGTDCHGTPITMRAKTEKKHPKEIADFYNDEFSRTFKAMNFSYNLYTQTDTEYHKQKVKEIFKKIYDNGYIIEKEEIQPYCPKCNKFLADRELILKCPKCGNDAKGEECDCGYTPTVDDLIKLAFCQECKTKVIEKKNKNLYLVLSKLQPLVEEYYHETGIKWRKNAQNETLKCLKLGLIDRAVTRDLDWGVDVPVNGYEAKKIYVWIEAVLGYLTASMKYCDDNHLDWKDYWENNDNTLMYMVHGKDNIIFHTIILPALLLAINENMKLPDKIVSCEYLNINDEKISKSKGNGVTILDLVEQYNVDSIRYYFLSNSPEKKDGNFSTEEFKAVHNSDLINKYGNFINRTLKFKGLQQINVGTLEPQIADKIKKTYDDVSTDIEKTEFRKAIEGIMDLVEFGNKYYDERKPWVLFKENLAEFNNVMYNGASIIANLANLFEPVMPEASNKIKDIMNIDISRWEYITLDKPVYLNDVSPLFERL